MSSTEDHNILESREENTTSPNLDSAPVEVNQFVKPNTQEMVSGRQLDDRGPNRVVVTSGNDGGHGVRHNVENIDKNVPPPRLPSSGDRRSSPYSMEYPGVNLRLLNPIPSHLTSSTLSHVNDVARRGEPQSINFGSSSQSRGAFYIQRQHPHRGPPTRHGSHTVPRNPINNYRPTNDEQQQTSSEGRFRPSKLMNVAKTSRPYSIHLHHQIESYKPHYKPSYHSGLRPPPPPPHPPQLPPPPPPSLYPLIPLDHAEHTTLSNDINSYEDVTHNALRTTPSFVRLGQSSDVIRGSIQDDPSAISSLTQLVNVNKSGSRRYNINHRTDVNNQQNDAIGSHSENISRRIEANTSLHGGRDTDSEPTSYKREGEHLHYQHKKHQQETKEQQSPPYKFRTGEVYTPTPLLPKPRRPSIRITTRRPKKERVGVPYEDNRGAYIPRYIKNNIQEMEFDPKTLDASHPLNSNIPGVPSSGTFQKSYASDYWFLMPVQAWFVLSIILSALVIVLIVVTIILYVGLRKQKKKVKKILSPNLLLGTCIDPLHHQLCTCRNGAAFLRSNQPFTRSSAMSRFSHRSVALPPVEGRPITGGQERQGPSASRSSTGIINYDNVAQQRTTGFRSLPPPSLREKQEMEEGEDQEEYRGSTITINTEVEEAPPPLAPKLSIGLSSGSGLKRSETNRQSIRKTSSNTGTFAPQKKTSFGDSFRYANTNPKSNPSNYTAEKQSKYQHPNAMTLRYQGSRMASGNSDVQLTTIYPPPTTFEL